MLSIYDHYRILSKENRVALEVTNNRECNDYINASDIKVTLYCCDWIPGDKCYPCRLFLSLVRYLFQAFSVGRSLFVIIFGPSFSAEARWLSYWAFSIGSEL